MLPRPALHAARYLSDPVYRRKISPQLNKGESLHALRRDPHYAQQGREIRDELLSSIAPGHRENINFFGFITVDIEAELAELIEGWRPLRPTTVTAAGTTSLLNP